MEISEKLLKHIIDTYGSDAKSIAKGIQHYKEINYKLENGRASLEKLRKDYEYNCQSIEGVMSCERVKCDHPVATQHTQRDPSGGSDKSTRCDICGKAW